MRDWKALAVLCLTSAALVAGPARAQEARPQAPARTDETAGDDFSRPPPGSPADQALWKEASDVDNAIPMQRGESAKLQWRVKQGQYNERIDRLEKQGPPEKAAQAKKAGVKVIEARDCNYEIITRKWPIDPTRVCSYALLDFTSALNASHPQGTPTDKALPGDARTRLRECVDRAQLILRSIEGSNKELAAALASLEALLPPAVPVTGPGGVPGPIPPVPPPGARAAPAATPPAGTK